MSTLLLMYSVQKSFLILLADAVFGTVATGGQEVILEVNLNAKCRKLASDTFLEV